MIRGFHASPGLAGGLPAWLDKEMPVRKHGSASRRLPMLAATVAIALFVAFAPAPVNAHQDCKEWSSRGGTLVCVKWRFHVHNPLPTAREKAREMWEKAKRPGETAREWLDNKLDIDK